MLRKVRTRGMHLFLSSQIWEGPGISEFHPWLKESCAKPSLSKQNWSCPVKTESLSESPSYFSRLPRFPLQSSRPGSVRLSLLPLAEPEWLGREGMGHTFSPHRPRPACAEAVFLECQLCKFRQCVPGSVQGGQSLRGLL